MIEIKQSSTNYELPFMMVDSNGDPVTSITPTVLLRKRGGSFAAAAGTIVEDGYGHFHVAGHATDSNTQGPLVLVATGTGAVQADMLFNVVANVESDTVTAIAALPTAAATATAVWAAGTRTLTAQSDTSGTTTLLTRLSSARAGYLDKLNVSGTLAHSDAAATYRADLTGLPSAAAIRAEMDSNSTQLAAIVEDTGTTLPDSLTLISNVTDKLDDTLEDDEGTYRFTGNALEQAPSGGGGGGDATAANQEDIMDAISSLHNLSSAQAQAAATAALTAFGPATASDISEALEPIATAEELAKVPRAGATFTHVNVETNASATVTIEEAE